MTDKMRVAFVTFGCRLNHAEALDMEARVAAAGHEIVNLGTVPTSPSGTVPANPLGTVPVDMIIVRCCSVTAKAQKDCEKEIARLRRLYPTSQIIPVGCLPGTVPINLPGTVPTASSGTVPMATSRAYLKVQDGCSGKCSFCVVPQFRGRPVSQPLDAILDRARAFLAAGFRELVITGCNLALYRDMGTVPMFGGGTVPDNGGTVPDENTDRGAGLADLLAALASIPPPVNADGELRTAPNAIHRIRIGSLEPGFCEERFIDTLSAHPNICRSIHISLQSGSNRILRLMNRPYTAERVAAFCRNVRKRVGARCAFGADVIAGFPGETEADHEATKQLLQMETDGYPVFSNLHVFPYSERPGTPAADFPDPIPVAVRKIRAKELEAIGRQNRIAFAQTFIDKEVVVCIEKTGDGWTDEYLRTKVPPGFPRRSLQRLRIASATDGNCYADSRFPRND